MEKRQALKETIDLWTQVADKTEETQTVVQKHDIPGPWQNYLTGCPLCEYCNSVVEERENCEECPVNWEVSITGRRRVYCCAPGSPYDSWIEAKTIDMKVLYARRVAMLAQEALEALDNE